MHEGFVNYNAGTLGASMVEGRISAGVVVGDGSDVGGGASIMGTLSRRRHRDHLASASAACSARTPASGISLGDDCVVEAGLYVTAGSRVALPDGEVVKAAELTGADGLLFRRNSQTGAIEALPAQRALGRPQRGAARERLVAVARRAARRRARTPRASARAPAAGSRAPASPKKEPGASDDPGLEQPRGQRSALRARVEPEEERRVAARAAQAVGLEHRQAARRAWRGRCRAPPRRAPRRPRPRSPRAGRRPAARRRRSAGSA